MQFPDRFILYRREWDAQRGKFNKIPCDHTGANINAHDPSQWRPFADRARYATLDEGRPDVPYGVGFVLNGDGLFCIDLDNCKEADGQWTDDAQMIWASFRGAPGEVSTSEKGLHVFGRCDPSQVADLKNKWDGKEWYHKDRFIALSRQGPQPIGDAYADKDWTHQLRALMPQREFLGELADGRDPAYTGSGDDDELIALMRRSSSAAAAVGGKATFDDLWTANAEMLCRFHPDPERTFHHSAADMALMWLLAFWTGRDAPRMDRPFRRSSLMRDKYRDRADYRRETIQKAARLVRQVYVYPRRVEGGAEPSGTDDHWGERRSQFYSAARLKGKPAEERQWLVPWLVPGNTVTLISGDGGTGKSFLALQFGVAVATGTPRQGMPVQQGGVVFVFAEDEDAEIHRRFGDVLKAQRLDYDDCKRLTLRSLAGEDALLAVEGKTALTHSALFKELERRVEAEVPALVVIDTLADVFPANENDRARRGNSLASCDGWQSDMAAR